MDDASSSSGSSCLVENYKLLQKLGEGSFGRVYKALDYESGKLVAIKILKNSVSFEECLYSREVQILRRMKDPNIVRLMKVVKKDQLVFMVFEYMEESLYQLISSKTSIPESEIRDRCFQILKGLLCMHQRGYFHRDLKPDNILVTGDVTKVADLGSAREVFSGGLPYDEYVTTRWYRAPEYLLRAKTYGPAVDMWALGAIMAEMFLRRPLFPGTSQIDQIHQIVSILGCPGDPSWCLDDRIFVLLSTLGVMDNQKRHLSALMPSASEEAMDLMNLLLSWDPNKRPTAQQALQHPFFRPCFKLPVHSMLPPLGLDFQPNHSCQFEFWVHSVLLPFLFDDD